MKSEDEFLAELKAAREEHEERDLEVLHMKADDLLCEAIRQFGWTRLVDAYEAIEKWYA